MLRGRELALQAGVIALVLAVQSPSLFHAPRGDQLCYLADMAGRDGLGELLAGSVSYNRAREFNPGDELLFRPITFVLLALERWAFGYRFLLWQAVSLLLHLGVVLQLMRLLREIRATPAVLALGLFFGVLFIGSELPAWHHLQGYLVLQILLLEALIRLWRCGTGDAVPARSLAAITALFTVACFTHEFGAVAATLASAWLVWRGWGSPRRWAGLWLVVPCVVWAGVNVLDYQIRAPVVSATVPSAMPLLAAVRHAVSIPVYWLAVGLMPLDLAAVPGDRIFVAPQQFTDVRRVLTPASIAGFIVAIAVVVIAVRAARIAGTDRRRSAFGVLAGSLLAAHVLVHVFGRVQARGVDEAVFYSSYYAGFAWLALVLLTHVFVDPSSAMGRPRFLLASAVAISIVLNAACTFRFQWRMAEWGRPRLELVRDVEERVTRGAPRAEFEALTSRPSAADGVGFLKRRGETNAAHTLLDLLWPDLLPRSPLPASP